MQSILLPPVQIDDRYCRLSTNLIQLVKTPPNSVARLHHALLELPRYNQFGVAAHNLQLPPIKSHIIMELSGSPGLPFGELVDRIGFEKAMVSKVVRQLVGDGVVNSRTSPHDGRVKHLSLTSNGKKLIASFDTVAETRVRRFVERSALRSIEVEQLTDLLSKAADALKAPPSVARVGEHMVRPALRRIARAFGLLGRRTLGSQLNALEWQILLSVCENPGVLTPLEASLLMGIPKHAIALALRELTERRYILKQQAPHDGRVFFLQPTQKGLRANRTMEENGLKSYKSAAGIPAHTVVLVERLVRAAAIEYHILRRGFSVRDLSSQDLKPLRTKAVAFYLENGVSEIPSAVFPTGARAYGLYNEERLLAAFEQGDRGACVENLFIATGTLPETVRAFVAHVMSTNLDTPVMIYPREIRSLLVTREISPTALGQLFT